MFERMPDAKMKNVQWRNPRRVERRRFQGIEDQQPIRAHASTLFGCSALNRADVETLKREQMKRALPRLE